eukprot:TRINITY_DN6573_c0_g1_i2.p1 TRINITY_DN6573_c0_g1~~TRINITY_DN6573_c0_g1_i2.p1  ORF type:complete len:503 (+),score=145.03 TRINITY_DN6573_c0_g1_i2:119-1627(+)
MAKGKNSREGDLTGNKKWKNQERQDKMAHRKNRERVLYGGDKWNRDFKKFNDQLNLFGLLVKDVAGDGNCLFRAVSDQMYGHPELHAQLRDQACNFIARNRENFEPFIEDDVPFDKYVAEMRQSSTWGGNMEIQALSSVLGVNVVIHQLDFPRWEVNNYGPQTRAIHISYHDGEHYASVRRIGNLTGIPEKIEIKLVNPGALGNFKKEEKSQDHVLTKAEETVLHATGSDIGLIRETLIEYGGDVDSTIEYLITLQQTETFPEVTFENLAPDKDPPPEKNEKEGKKEEAPVAKEVPKPSQDTTDSLENLEQYNQTILEQEFILIAAIEENISANEDSEDLQIALESLMKEKEGVAEKIKQAKAAKQAADDQLLAFKLMIEDDQEANPNKYAFQSKDPPRPVKQEKVVLKPSPSPAKVELEKEVVEPLAPKEPAPEIKKECQKDSADKQPSKPGKQEHMSNRQRKQMEREKKKERGQKKAEERKKEKQVEVDGSSQILGTVSI